MNLLAQTIQIALAPVFLLVAVGGLLNVFVFRLSRVVDRAREVTERCVQAQGDERIRLIKELHIHDRRMKVINASIGLSVVCGIVVCLMVSMLFIMGSSHNSMVMPISTAFIFSMILLLGALVLFMIEVRLAFKAIQIPQDVLDIGPERTTTR